MGTTESTTPSQLPDQLLSTPSSTPSSMTNIPQYPKYSPHELSIGQNITFPQINPLYRNSTLTRQAQKQQEFKFIREHCKKLSFFADLPEEKIKDIVGKFRICLSTDQWLFKEGSNATYFFIIVEGHVEIVKNGYLIRNLGAGDYFGEMALLYGIKRSSSVRVVKQYRSRNIYYCLHKKAFLQAILFPTPQKIPHYLTLIQSHPSFLYLTHRDKVHLAQKATKIKFQANERILTKYDQPFALFAIDSGKVQLNFRNKRSMGIGSKCIFGYFGSQEIWCSAMCLEQTIVYAIGKDAVNQLLKTNIKYLFLWHKVYYTLMSSFYLTKLTPQKIQKLTNKFTYTYITQKIQPITLCQTPITKIYIPINASIKQQQKNKNNQNTQNLYRCLYQNINQEQQNLQSIIDGGNGGNNTGEDIGPRKSKNVRRSGASGGNSMLRKSSKLNLNISGSVKNKRCSRMSKLSSINKNLNSNNPDSSQSNLNNTNTTIDINNNNNKINSDILDPLSKQDQKLNPNLLTVSNISNANNRRSQRQSKLKIDTFNLSMDMSSTVTQLNNSLTSNNNNPTNKTNPILTHNITKQPIGLAQILAPTLPTLTKTQPYKSSSHATTQNQNLTQTQTQNQTQHKYKYDYVGQKGNYYASIQVEVFLKAIKERFQYDIWGSGNGSQSGSDDDERGNGYFQAINGKYDFGVYQEIGRYKCAQGKFINSVRKQKKYQLHYLHQTPTSPQHTPTLLTNIQIHLTLSSKFIQSIYYYTHTSQTCQVTKQLIRGKTMFEYMKKIGLLPFYVSRFYIGCMIVVMGYLHGKGIVCQGLGFWNWVVGDCDGYLWFVEGVLRRVGLEDCGEKSGKSLNQRLMGKADLYRKRKLYSQNIWKLGQIAYEILIGHPLQANTVQTTQLEFPHNFKHKESKQLLQTLILFNQKQYNEKTWQKIKELNFFKNFDWQLFENKQIEAPIVPRFMTMNVRNL